MRGESCSMKTTSGCTSDPEGDNVEVEVGAGRPGSNKRGAEEDHHDDQSPNHHHHHQQQQDNPSPTNKPGDDVDMTTTALEVNGVSEEKTTTTPGRPSSSSPSSSASPTSKKKNPGGNHQPTPTTSTSSKTTLPAPAPLVVADGNNDNYNQLLEQYYRHLDDDLEAHVEPIPSSNNDASRRRHQQQATMIPGAYAFDSPVSPGMMGTLRDSQQSHTTEDSDEAPSTAASANGDGLLAEALPVNEEQDMISTLPRGYLMEAAAQPVQEQARTIQENKDRQCRRLMLVFLFLVACIVVLTVAISLTISNKKGDPAGTIPRQQTGAASEESTGTKPPTRFSLPPMENLEVLYEELSPKTKESLSNNNSPQYLAWEWLRNHPNITTYPEWRKKQIFAMVTFYHSFQGEYWSDSTPSYGRWMDYNNSECSWIMKDKELNYFHQQSLLIFGPVYTFQEVRPCNDGGQLQIILLPQLSIKQPPTAGTPSIPPEISLLTSLKMLVILHSQLGNARFAEDILIPELIQLPNLIHLSLQGSDVRGTIPKEISQMTKLVRLSLGSNRLSGSIPWSQLAKMTSLEQLLLDDVEGITGVLPSDLGLMTSLTSLEIARNSFTGQIPTELGNLTSLKRLALGGNQKLSGVLPYQLWELSHMEKLHLSDLPNLHGSIPSTDIDIMMRMPNLTTLRLDGSPHLSGTVPDQACLLVEELEFDCGDSLCGCDDCPCNVDYHNHSGSGHNNTQSLAAVWNKSLP